jgi:hypothetical protein
MKVFTLHWVARSDNGCFIASETPKPHEVPLQSLHSFQSSGNNSVFLSGVQFTSAVRNTVCSPAKRLFKLGK